MQRFDNAAFGGVSRFPEPPYRNEDEEKAARIAWENRPSVVLGEVALILAVTTAFIAAIDIILMVLHIG